MCAKKKKKKKKDRLVGDDNAFKYFEVTEKERKRTDMELCMVRRKVGGGRLHRPEHTQSQAPGVKYAPLEVQTAAQNLKISNYVCEPREEQKS